MNNKYELLTNDTKQLIDLSYEKFRHSARLLAAAPDLLEALKKAASHIEAMMAHIEHKPERFKQHCWQQVLDARVATAKATGSQK